MIGYIGTHWRGAKVATAIVLSAALSAQATTTAADQSEHNQRPNIVLVLADDLSFVDCSFMGQKQFSTPHIDRLANTGLVFRNAYAGSSECAPSRASLLTGMHMGHCRIRANESARGQDHLEAKDQTMAEILKQADYACAMVGKWGVGLPGTEGVPYKQGFDYSFGYYDQVQAHTFFPHYMMENERIVPLRENYGFNMERLYAYGRRTVDTLDDVANRYDENGTFVADFVAGSPGEHNPSAVIYSEDLVLSRAIRFIRENKDRPFFLYYASQLPHGPTVIPNLGPFKDKPSPWSLKHKEWAAMISRLDRSVGTLVDEIYLQGLTGKTLILFASDNGYSAWGYFGRSRYEDDPLFKNKGPWDKGKFMCRDGGVRVPLVACWPGRIKPGMTNHVCALYDLPATLAELADVTPEQPMDGISLAPTLFDRATEQRAHRYLYWENGTYSPHAQAARFERWYAYRDDPSEPMELYDLQTDPSCTTDVAAANPDTVRLAVKYFDEAHVDSEWYCNPKETSAQFQAKREKACREGSIQVSTKPNTTYPSQ